MTPSSSLSGPDLPAAATEEPPLVSIGVPTYNRVELLRRAIDSVLGQTHRNLELVISDNASSDSTPALVRTASERDARVHYHRQPANVGPTANLNKVMELSHGDYVMLLSDDDWLDGEYVERCLRALESRPDLALACGAARYFERDREVRREAPLELTSASSSERVLDYWRQLEPDNVAFFGMRSRATQERLAPMSNVMGNDQMLVASIAFIGKTAVVDGAFLNRSTGGASATKERLAEVSLLPRRQRRRPYISMAGLALIDVLWRSPVFRILGWPRRAALGCACAWHLLRRHHEYVVVPFFHARVLIPFHGSIVPFLHVRVVSPTRRMLRRWLGEARGRLGR